MRPERGLDLSWRPSDFIGDFRKYFLRLGKLRFRRRLHPKYKLGNVPVNYCLIYLAVVAGLVGAYLLALQLVVLAVALQILNDRRKEPALFLAAEHAVERLAADIQAKGPKREAHVGFDAGGLRGDRQDVLKQLRVVAKKLIQNGLVFLIPVLPRCLRERGVGHGLPRHADAE